MIQRIKNALLRRYNKYVRIPRAHKAFTGIQILNSVDSIKYIIEHKCSVSRFGDGEFVMMLGGGYDGYQSADTKLEMRLRQVLMANDATNLMKGIPFPMKETSNLRCSSKEFWDYFTLRYGGGFCNIFPQNAYI